MVALPPNLAECQPDVGEFLLEGFVHVLLEVRGFDVFNDRRLKRKTRRGVNTTALSTLSKAIGSSHTSVGFQPSHHEASQRAVVTHVA